MSRHDYGFAALNFLNFLSPAISQAQNETGGTFTFPEVGSRGSYNSLDTLNVSWSIAAPVNFTDPYLMFWVGTFPSQQLVYNQSAPSTSSALVPLDFDNAFNNSNFVLQQGPTLNTGAPFFSSGSFEIRNDRDLKGATYNLAGSGSAPTSAPATPISSSTSTSSTTSSPPPTLPATLAPSPTATASDISTTTSSSTTPPVIALAVLTSLFAALVLALGILYLYRRSRRRCYQSHSHQAPHLHPFSSAPSSNSSPVDKSASFSFHQPPAELPPSRFFGFFARHPERASSLFGQVTRNVTGAGPGSMGSGARTACCGNCGASVPVEAVRGRPGVVSELPGRDAIGVELGCGKEVDSSAKRGSACMLMT